MILKELLFGSVSRNQAVVLNEGVTIISRNKVEDSDESDEDGQDESELVEEEEEEVVEPARDPLDVEEEELLTKIQTACFLLSVPEEEMIRRRLLEIKQMREHPEMFRPENTYSHK